MIDRDDLRLNEPPRSKLRRISRIDATDFPSPIISASPSFPSSCRGRKAAFAVTMGTTAIPVTAGLVVTQTLLKAIWQMHTIFTGFVFVAHTTHAVRRYL